MYIILITRYKRKLLYLGAFVLFWAAVLIPAGIVARTRLFFNITINSELNFSYPLTFNIDDIYINESVTNSSIETNISFCRPRQLKFSTYNSIEGKFSFSYPSIYVLSLKEFTGSEILYHIEFNDKSNDAYGFVQVWNMPYSLEQFLSMSKATAMQNYTQFEEKPTVVNGLHGYQWDYVLTGSDGRKFRGAEVFLKKDDRMYRVSYFVPEPQWNSSHAEIFMRIVNSLKVS